jgi:hypothetical protein
METRTKHSGVRHTGADLVGRATSLVIRTTDRGLDMDAVAKNVHRLAAIPLGYSPTKTAMDSAIAHWVGYLAKFKINREDARQICKNASAVGSDLDARNPIDVYTKEVMAARNMYDLFCSILRYSRNQYHITRDLLQSAAMDLLLPIK